MKKVKYQKKTTHEMQDLLETRATTKIQQGKQKKTKTKHCCKKNKINNEKNKKLRQG